MAVPVEVDDGIVVGFEAVAPVVVEEEEEIQLPVPQVLSGPHC